MADKTQPDAKPTADVSKTSRPNGLETTTTNDGSLAINQQQNPAPDPSATNTVTKPTELVSEPVADTVAKSAPAANDTVVQTPAAAPPPDSPVVVSEADVAAAEKENDPHETLGEQIEVLTGEVQALESKIEKLTSGVGEATAEPPVVKKDGEAVVSTPSVTDTAKASSKPEAPTPAEPPKPKVEEPPPPPPPLPLPPVPAAQIPPATISQPAKPVNDIYTKILNGPQQGQTPPTDHKDLNDDATLEESSSGLGTIGEVLIVFGMIALLILLASPFLKTTLGANWEAVKSIGWPTSTVSLGLGFFLFLFNKGRLAFKVFAFLLFLVAAAMLVAVFDYATVLGPLGNFLGPIATFYK